MFAASTKTSMQLLNRLRTVIIFFCCSAAQLLSGQSLPFIPFTTANGLSQNSVHCIFQDSRGTLWIGTQYGLNRFDGRSFRVYRHIATDSQSLSDPFILSINEDAAGYLWVGTGNGLNRFNPRTGKCNRYYLQPGEADRISSHYASLPRHPDGTLLVVHGGGPLRINQQGRTEISDSNLLQLYKPVFDSSGRIWGFTKSGQLLSCLLQSEKRVHFRQTLLPPTLQHTAGIRYRCTVKNGFLWCWPEQTSGMIVRFNLQSKLWDSLELQVPAPVNELYVAENGAAWICTMKGLYLLQPGQRFPVLLNPGELPQNGLPAGNILCAYEDSHQNLWVGSASAGIAYYHPRFSHIRLLQTEPVSAVTCTATDRQGRQWLGTSTGLLLYSMSADDPATRQQMHLFKRQRVTGVAIDAMDQIWVSLEKDGLYILNSTGKVIRTYRRQDSLLYTRGILSLFCDSKNRIIACTERGYYIFRSPDQWESFYQGPDKPQPTGWYTLTVYEDRNHHLWFCKHLGVDRLDEDLQPVQQIESGTTRSPIRRSIVTACTEDTQGRIWLATLNAGIYLYDQRIVRQYTITEGLAANAVYGICTDSSGRIWATTASGISVLENGSPSFYTLTRRDGLPVNDFVIGALLAGKYNRVYAGSSAGLITINSGAISTGPGTAVAQLEDIRINDQSVETLQFPLKVPYGYQTISFDFSVKEPLQPAQIIYQYRLLGADSHWISLPVEHNRIAYTHLPYRRLLLQVRAAGSVNALTHAPVKTYILDIQAPFWNNNWFRLFTILLTGGACWLGFRKYAGYKLRKQQEAMRMQQQLQAERERISRDLHDNIGAYTSALIAGIQQLQQEKPDYPQLSEMHEYASGMMGYLRETIWVLNNQQLLLSAFADRFKLYAGRMIRHYPGIRLEFREDITVDGSLAPERSLQLFRILQEALQNACKHAHATSIEIGFRGKQPLTIYVKDDGSGIQPGAGTDQHGLHNMQERALACGMHISIESAAGAGTTITLTENSAYAG